MLKQLISEDSINNLVQSIMLGETWPENIKLSDLKINQIEYIKNQCYRNITLMLQKMQLLDDYMKDKNKITD